MLRRLKYIRISAKASFNSMFVYKSANLVNIINQFILVVFQVFLWKLLFQDADSIRQYSFDDVISYIVFSTVLVKLYPFNVAKKYAEIIKSGDIVNFLLKPVGMEVWLFSESLGETAYHFIFSTLPVLGISIFFFDIEVSFVSMGMTILTVALSYGFIFYMELAIGSVSYKTQSLWGINNFKTSVIRLLAGRFIPINFYPPTLSRVLKYLPFSAMYYLPINLLLQKEMGSLQTYLLMLVSGTMGMCLIYRKTSQSLIRNIMVQGG